ncbi:hypothetical protein [Aidingimonas lacisalsi]|uniref:hypothetical protein n=1 Tax=Aidingimonas lacisalsi TaxID=2604086 RepID=UPI001375FE21|nr:hypothetical protein [Aidingimonas lacisalsi]
MARDTKSSRRMYGATRRPRVAPFDRWLNRLVDLLVLSALLVGGVALVVSLWPGLP